MNIIFEVTDKNNKSIRLTKEQWSKIRKKHPEIEKEEMIKETLEKPTKVIYADYDGNICKFYRHYKERYYPENFLMVITKYLNGHGFIIKAYFIDKIK